MKNTQDTEPIFNLKKFILHLVLLSILGISIGVVVVYKVFPYKLINSNQFYGSVIIDSGFADFFHSIFPIQIENKVKFRKVQDTCDLLEEDDELPFLPIKHIGILSKHKSEYYSKLYERTEIEEYMKMDNKAREKLVLLEDHYGTGYLPILMNPYGARILEEYELNHYHNGVVMMVNLYKMNMTLHEWYEFEMKSDSRFKQIDTDDE